MDRFKGTHSVIEKLAVAGSCSFLQARKAREGNHVARNQRRGRMWEVLNRRCALGELLQAREPREWREGKKHPDLCISLWPLSIPPTGQCHWERAELIGVCRVGLLGTKRVGRGQGVEGSQSGVVLGIHKTRVCVRAPEILLPSHCGRKVHPMLVWQHPTRAEKGGNKRPSCIAKSYATGDALPESPGRRLHRAVPLAGSHAHASANGWSPWQTVLMALGNHNPPSSGLYPPKGGTGSWILRLILLHPPAEAEGDPVLCWFFLS